MDSIDIGEGWCKIAIVPVPGFKVEGLHLHLQHNISSEPRKTKHHGEMARPIVAEEYLKHAASIDIHNHLRTGSQGLEDVWRTKNPHRRQLAGILSFCFTNSF